MPVSTVKSQSTSQERKSVLNITKALSDPTRLRMLRLLISTGSELCVCEFVDTLQERLYNISKHLKVLEQVGLIDGSKEGRWDYYSVIKPSDPFYESIHRLVSCVPGFDTLFDADLSRFNDRMKLREDGRCRVGIQSRQLAE